MNKKRCITEKCINDFAAVGNIIDYFSLLALDNPLVTGDDRMMLNDTSLDSRDTTDKTKLWKITR